jgi:hypothetical protein
LVLFEHASHPAVRRGITRIHNQRFRFPETQFESTTSVGL